MTFNTAVDKYGNEVTLNSADDIAIASNGTGFDLARAGGTLFDTVRFNEIDSTTANPKLEIIVNGTTVQTIDLNKNDVSLEGSLSDFDLTDDIVDFVNSEGVSQGTLNFSKYNITATVNGDGDVEISQDGTLLATVSQNADGITFDPSTSTLTAIDVQTAIEEVNTKIDSFSGGVEFQDDFVATGAQTAFTLTNAPISGSQVNVIRNGVTLAKASVSISGTTATYDPVQNGANPMVAGDRVTFTYEY